MTEINTDTGVVLETLNNKADIDLNNLNDAGKQLFNNKADRDLNNVPSSINFMTEVGGNYTKWRNGFTILKGSKDFGEIGSNAGINVVINLPTPMPSAFYMVNVTLTFTGTYFANLAYSVVNKTTTTFTVRIYNNNASGSSAAGSFNWIAVGY